MSTGAWHRVTVQVRERELGTVAERGEPVRQEGVVGDETSYAGCGGEFVFSSLCVGEPLERLSRRLACL